MARVLPGRALTFKGALGTGRYSSLDRKASGKAVFSRPENAVNVETIWTFFCKDRVHNVFAPYFSASILKTLRLALPENLRNLRVGVHNAFKSSTPYLPEHLATGLYIKLRLTIPVTWLPTLELLMQTGLFHTVFEAPLLKAPQTVGLLVCSNNGQSLFGSRRQCIVSGWPSYYMSHDVVNALVAVEGITGPITATQVVSRQVTNADVIGAFMLTEYTTTFPDVLELGMGRNRVEILFSSDVTHDLPYGNLVLIPLPPPPSFFPPPSPPGKGPPRPPREDIQQSPATTVASRAGPSGVRAPVVAANTAPAPSAAAPTATSAPAADAATPPPPLANAPADAVAATAAANAATPTPPPATALADAVAATAAAADAAPASTAATIAIAPALAFPVANEAVGEAHVPNTAIVVAVVSREHVTSDAMEGGQDDGATTTDAGTLHPPALPAQHAPATPHPRTNGKFLPRSLDSSTDNEDGVWERGQSDKKKDKDAKERERSPLQSRMAGTRSKTPSKSNSHLPHHE
jgi:hypothetical protein